MKFSLKTILLNLKFKTSALFYPKENYWDQNAISAKEQNPSSISISTHQVT